MKKVLDIDQKTIEYTHKIHRRSKRIRLAIFPGGEVIVTTPRGVGASLINRFIISKSRWILSKLDYLKNFRFSLPSQTPKNIRNTKQKRWIL